MKKTSRRKFGGQLAAALVTLPAVSSLDTPTYAQSRKQQPRRANVESIYTSHDTPPPILIGEGSLILERNGEFQAGDIVMQADRLQHHIRPDPGKNKIYPAHIKVLDGSGEMLYRNDRAEQCVITIQAKDGEGHSATVTAKASPIVSGKQTFIIDTDGNKGFDKTNELKPDSHKKRNVRYRHKKQGAKEFSITTANITLGAYILYEVTLGDLPSKGEEFRIMVWTEQS